MCLDIFNMKGDIKKLGNWREEKAGPIDQLVFLNSTYISISLFLLEFDIYNEKNII